MRVEGGGKYQVKLIEPHNHRNDTILEIISSLEHLSSITSQIFGAIGARIAQHKAHVNELSLRASAAATHVHELKNSKAAIRIISPAKFPREVKPEEDKVGLLDSELTFPNVPRQKGIEEIRREFGITRDRDREFPIKNSDELLQSYHVREKSDPGHGVEPGLGQPPPGAKTIDSFYLFNSIENPYKDDRIFERHQKEKQRSLRMSKRKEEETHQEVTSPTGQFEEDPDDFYYPTMIQIPEIDVPDHLPDLPGIATNFDISPSPTTSMLTFHQRMSPSVSPGAANANAVQSITTTTSKVIIDVPPAQSSSRDSTDNSSKGRETHSRDSVKPETGPPPAPPPPPPPGPGLLPPPINQEAASTSTVKKSMPETDMRNSLMEAIRKAGGSGGGKLKSAKERRYEEKKKRQEEKEQEESGSGVDLIADLKNTLALRRKGISGINESQNKAGLGDIMHKLASTIPVNSMLDDSNDPVNPSDDDDWD